MYGKFLDKSSACGIISKIYQQVVGYTKPPWFCISFGFVHPSKVFFFENSDLVYKNGRSPGCQKKNFN